LLGLGGRDPDFAAGFAATDARVTNIPKKVNNRIFIPKSFSGPLAAIRP